MGAILILTGLILAFPPLFERARDPKVVAVNESASYQTATSPATRLPLVPTNGIQLPDHPGKDVAVLPPSSVTNNVGAKPSVSPKPAASAGSGELSEEVSRGTSGQTRATLPEALATKPPEKTEILLQVGVFASSHKAGILAKKLRKHGFKVISEEVSINGSKRLRIRVGPYPTRTKARKVIEQLKALDVPSMMVVP